MNSLARKVVETWAQLSKTSTTRDHPMLVIEPVVVYCRWVFDRLQYSKFYPLHSLQTTISEINGVLQKIQRGQLGPLGHKRRDRMQDLEGRPRRKQKAESQQ